MMRGCAALLLLVAANWFAGQIGGPSALGARAALAGESSGFWTVKAVSGAVTVRAGSAEAGEWIAVEAGDVLPFASTVVTGDSGRATLVHGQDTMSLSPSSEVELPAPGKNGMTRVLERVGSVFLTVEKRPSQHFQVETPYLVALVKGTSFRVDVDEKKASVSVAEGTVGVKDKRTGREADVSAGETGSVTRASSAGVSVQATAAKPAAAAKSAKAKTGKPAAKKSATKPAATKKPGAAALSSSEASPSMSGSIGADHGDTSGSDGKGAKSGSKADKAGKSGQGAKADKGDKPGKGDKGGRGKGKGDGAKGHGSLVAGKTGKKSHHDDDSAESDGTAGDDEPFGLSGKDKSKGASKGKHHGKQDRHRGGRYRDVVRGWMERYGMNWNNRDVNPEYDGEDD